VWLWIQILQKNQDLSIQSPHISTCTRYWVPQCWDSGNVQMVGVPPSRDMSVHTTGNAQLDSVPPFRDILSVQNTGDVQVTTCLRQETCWSTPVRMSRAYLYPETCPPPRRRLDIATKPIRKKLRKGSRRTWWREQVVHSMLQ
jgi:hypothetical protein